MTNYIKSMLGLAHPGYSREAMNPPPPLPRQKAEQEPDPRWADDDTLPDFVVPEDF